nr:putative NAD(P)H-dependent glycerol-3-phosphate dehydrogenase [uncultured bacterium]
MKVTVLGSGSWGTTVASLAARRNDSVVWARRVETADEINEQHTNVGYLDGFSLHPRLRAQSDLEQACRRAEVLVVGVPSHVFRSVLIEAKPFIAAGIPIVSISKGLEGGSNLRMTQMINELFPGHPAAALTGPNLAKEIMAGCAAASVLAVEDQRVGAGLQDVFRQPLFRVYRNHDVIGCELGGALKNVVALATGIAQGLSVGDNTRSMVITRGLAELTRLGVALGGEAPTFAGLAGMGDLIATCISPQSRNRYVGEQLGRGRSLEEITSEMSSVAEGVKVAPVVAEVAAEHGVEMPVCGEVHKVLIGEIQATDAYRGLLRTPGGHETDPTGSA